MSNTGSELAYGLMQMAQDAAKVPELERQIADLKAIADIRLQASNNLEQRLMEHSLAHDETKSKLKAAEAARDDAEMRFLEADEKSTHAVRMLRETVAQAKELIALIDPPAPVPPKPSYVGKWLTDVDGWTHITLEEWQLNGGELDKFNVTTLTTRFVSTEPVREQPTSPLAASASGSGVGAEPNPTASTPVSWDHLSQPVHTDPARETDTVTSTTTTESVSHSVGVGEHLALPEAASGRIEGESATDPTVLATLDNTGNSVQSQCAPKSENASQHSTIEQWQSSEPLKHESSTDGVSVPLDPTANQSPGYSFQPAHSRDVCDQASAEGRESLDPTNAPTAGLEKSTDGTERTGSSSDDWWPQVSTASHFS